jgi:hypothetical protein
LSGLPDGSAVQDALAKASVVAKVTLVGVYRRG